MTTANQKAAMKNTLLILATTWQILQLLAAVKILGFDCEKNTTKIAVFANKEISPCKQPENKINTFNVMIQALQVKLYENLHVFHCLVTKLSIITYCGKFSYASMQKNGLIDEVLKISPETCEQMHKQKVFHYKDITFDGLEANTTKSTSFVEYGYIAPGATCDGVSFETKQGFYENAIMSSTIRIRLEDYQTIINKHHNSIYFEDGQTCPIKGETCFSADKGTTIWENDNENCAEDTVDVIYEGVATAVTTSGNQTLKIGDAILVDTDKKIFAHEIVGISHLCYQKIFNTNLPRVKILVKNPTYGFFFKKSAEIIAQNIDIGAYMNSKIYYVTKKIYNTMQTIYEEIKFASCQMEHSILTNKLARIRHQKTTYGHVLTEDPGFVGITAGDATYILECSPVMVAVRSTDKCYQNLPITYNGKETFMETEGRTIVDMPSEIPCSPLTPPKFKIAGKWLKLDRGHFQLTDEPIILSPQKNHYNIQFDNLNNILLGGIYTENDLEKFTNFITFPQRQKKANDFVTGRIISQHDSNPLSMNKIFTKEDLADFKDNILVDLDQGLLKFGAYMGAIIGIGAIFNVIRTLISTAINFRLLRMTLGNGIHLLASCFTSVTNYIIRNNYENNEAEETEMSALAANSDNSATNIRGTDANEAHYGRAREQLEIITTNQ